MLGVRWGRSLDGGLPLTAVDRAYPLLLSIIMAWLVEATGTPVDYPNAGY
jgi:hypothetical protein